MSYSLSKWDKIKIYGYVLVLAPVLTYDLLKAWRQLRHG